MSDQIEISDVELDAIAAEALSDVAEVEGFEEAATPTRKPKKSDASGNKMFIRQSQLQDDLKFSELNIDDAMMSQASLYSHYATQAAKAQLQADRSKNQLELVEAQIDKDLRDKAADEGVKITEAAIAKQIKLDERYQDASTKMTEAKMIASMTKSTTEAFAQRRDMLVQIGKDLREERLGELRTKANTDRLGDLKDKALDAMKAS